MDHTNVPQTNPVLNDVLAVGDEIEALMAAVISTQTLTQDAELEQYMSAMAVRCLNYLRATLLLSRKGLAQPAAGCVRSLIEQRWVFVAIAAKDTREEALQRLRKMGEFNRKKGCDNLRKLPTNVRDIRITEDALSAIEASLDIEAEYSSLKKWAELAKCALEYLVAYALLCNRTHPSAHAIESHLLFDDVGRVLSVTANPDIDSLPGDVLLACRAMIDVLDAGPGAWKTENVVTVATEFRQRIEKLLQKVPDLLASV